MVVAMPAVDPTGQDLKRLLADHADRPITMLNLLRFKPGGRVSYRAYSRAMAPFLEQAGAEVVHIGDCGAALVAPDGHDWDAVLLVRYPSGRAFSAMVADPGYQQITHLRTEALEAAVLQPTTAWATPAPS
jgi:uncharacterized protein (DUF1330 family)